MVKFLANTDPSNRVTLILVGYGLIIFIGVLDYLTGNELAFSVFYVIPIFLITWVAGRKSGLLASFFCASTWLLADAATTHFYSSHLVPIWNTIIRLAFFIIITVLLSSLKSSLKLANTDPLTSAVNSRYFQEILQMEINRFQRYRHPFTLAYIDLDDFKTMNDQFGHLVGDSVLCSLVSTVRRAVRTTDFIARLGGDEFILLFPEAEEEAAHVICTKIRHSFQKEMMENGWPVTFSIGVLTCRSTPETVDELIRMADELMYTAESRGKDQIKYSTYSG